MKKKIDINCDMGESYYNKKIGNDSKIMPFITSCNIACGFHGGDPGKQPIKSWIITIYLRKILQLERSWL